MRVVAVLGIVLAIAVGLAGAPPAGGTETGADTEDVAAAREFSYAAYRLRVAVKAQGPHIAARRAELSQCSDELEKAPRRVRNVAMEKYYTAEAFILFDAGRAPLAVFVAELDRIPVRDRALRRGRAAWRHGVDALATVAPVPADVCAQFVRWREAGYTKATRPAVDTQSVRRLSQDEETSARMERRLRAAVRRMQELGIRRGTAERFGGDTLFEGIPELEVEIIK